MAMLAAVVAVAVVMVTMGGGEKAGRLSGYRGLAPATTAVTPATSSAPSTATPPATVQAPATAVAPPSTATVTPPSLPSTGATAGDPGNAPKAPGGPPALRPGDPRGATTKESAESLVPWAPSAGDAKGEDRGKTYRVASGGESVYQVARRALGDEKRWREIVEANTGVIRDIEKIAAGTELRLPEEKTQPAPKRKGIAGGID